MLQGAKILENISFTAVPFYTGGQYLGAYAKKVPV
jgi:hypothetical protein